MLYIGIKQGLAKQSIYSMTQLPSQHQIGDLVLLNLSLSDIVNPPSAEVIGIIFYEDKVKYNLEVQLGEGHFTRIYNVDSVFVIKIVDTEFGEVKTI